MASPVAPLDRIPGRVEGEIFLGAFSSCPGLLHQWRSLAHTIEAADIFWK